MSASMVIVYPVPDYTGTLDKYKVTNEVRNLVDEEGYYLFIPWSGPYFADTLKIYNADTDVLLVEGEDYYYDVLLAEATAKANKDIFGAIKISKEKYPTLDQVPSMRLEYSFLGGPFHPNISGLLQAVNDMESSSDIIYWDNIKGKPTVYPPSFHLHDASDITGLENTNDILRAINVSIQELGERLVEAKAPVNNVTYSGRVKYALDAGRELQSVMGNSFLLQIPRSPTETAQFGLDIEIITAKRRYYAYVIGKEAAGVGFDSTSLSLETDLTLDYNIVSAELITLIGLSYIKVTLDGNIPTGNYVVRQATVNYHTPENWVEPFIWSPAVPNSEDPEYITLPLPIIDGGGLRGEEQTYNLKKHLNTAFNDILEDGDSLNLAFPVKSNLGYNGALTLKATKADGTQYQFKVSYTFDSDSGNFTNVKSYSLTKDVTDLMVGSISYLNGQGYLNLTTNGGITVDCYLDEVRVSTAGSELHFGYKFETNVDLTGFTTTDLTGDILPLNSYAHTHETSEINGLDSALETIGNTQTSQGQSIATLQNAQSTLSNTVSNQADTITQQGQAIAALQGKVVASQYSLDLTALDDTLYYLVKIGNSADNLFAPINLAATVLPDEDLSTATQHGNFFGKFMSANAGARADYYEYTALINDVDETKFPFDSIWYNVPTDGVTEAAMYLYVKGGETLHLETTFNSVELMVGDVTIDDAVVVTSGVGTIPVADTVWIKLTDLVANTKSTSLAVS